MKWGIDISEHNRPLPWPLLKKQGLSFVIVRLGWGAGHLDSRFYEYTNGVLDAGLALGIYYYSYALTEEAAAEEARFTAFVLKDCGLPPEKLAMGCWLDMEDADDYKERNGLTEGEEITALCRAYLEEMEKQGFPAGLYSSFSWLEDIIHLSALPEGTPLWCAQWGSTCSQENARLWQFTNALPLDGQMVDGDILW
ncbi:GH25 family lysozyme [uncultured Dialister sp.]|uniref:GH25 family lysozyme n=1 Tax=uncultured Dialister sp. TaxID=278064 RepID=UPI00261AEFA5|nr:GH25 family lysozyme [uncultured Dialister sp.]